MKVAIKYPSGTIIESDWNKSDLYCPSCGKKEVYEESSGGGDYYCGESHICISCGVWYKIQGPAPSATRSWGEIELSKLREVFK